MPLVVSFPPHRFGEDYVDSLLVFHANFCCTTSHCDAHRNETRTVEQVADLSATFVNMTVYNTPKMTADFCRFFSVGNISSTLRCFLTLARMLSPCMYIGVNLYREIVNNLYIVRQLHVVHEINSVCDFKL